MARAIDAEKAIEVAQFKYNEWNLAMAAADGQREINLCFKKQELFKAVKAVLDCVPTLTPPNEPLTVDELREINGEPIYVTTKNYGDGWCILNWHGVNKSYTYFSRTGTSEGMTATPLSAKTYGDLWLAYRRPPEGEEDA